MFLGVCFFTGFYSTNISRGNWVFTVPKQTLTRGANIGNMYVLFAGVANTPIRQPAPRRRPPALKYVRTLNDNKLDRLPVDAFTGLSVMERL